jgi:hypothetical protein
MKIEDVEKLRCVVENIDRLNDEYQKISSLSHFTVSHDDKDREITRISLNGYSILVSLDKYLDLIKSAKEIVDERKSQLVEDLTNV